MYTLIRYSVRIKMYFKQNWYNNVFKLRKGVSIPKFCRYLIKNNLQHPNICKKLRSLLNLHPDTFRWFIVSLLTFTPFRISADFCSCNPKILNWILTKVVKLQAWVYRRIEEKECDEESWRAGTIFAEIHHRPARGCNSLCLYIHGEEHRNVCF